MSMLSRFATTGGGVATDPYWANVTFMIVGNGANNSTTNIVDSSNVNASITNSGVVISTSQNKYGSGSLLFNVSAKLSTSQVSSMNLTTQSFTIDFWIYPTVTGGAYITCGGNKFYIVNINGTLYVGDGAYNQIVTSAPANNSWTYVSLTSTSSTMYLFYNGVLKAQSGNVVNTGVITDWTLGYFSQTGAYFNGYMYDLRITKEVARYTATFTPPTAPLPTTGP